MKTLLTIIFIVLLASVQAQVSFKIYSRNLLLNRNIPILLETSNGFIIGNSWYHNNSRNINLELTSINNFKSLKIYNTLAFNNVIVDPDGLSSFPTIQDNHVIFSGITSSLDTAINQIFFYTINKNEKITIKEKGFNYTQSNSFSPFSNIYFIPNEILIVNLFTNKSPKQTIISIDKDFKVNNYLSFVFNNNLGLKPINLAKIGNNLAICYKEPFDQITSNLGSILSEFNINRNMFEKIVRIKNYTVGTIIAHENNLLSYGILNVNDTLNDCIILLDSNFNLLKIKLNTSIYGNAGIDIDLAYNKILDSQKNVFIPSVSKSGNMVLCKFNANMELQWTKVLPVNSRYLITKSDSILISSMEKLADSTEIKLFMVDNDGIGNPSLPDYCSPVFEDSITNLVIEPFDDFQMVPTGPITVEHQEVFPTTFPLVVREDTITYITPQADFDLPSDMCVKECATLTSLDQGIVDASTYWIDDVEVSSPFCADTAGDYDILHRIVYYGGCEDSITKSIRVHDLPDYDATDEVIHCDDLSPINLSVAYDENNTLLWSDGSNDNPKSIDQAGWYKFQVSNNQCTVVDSIHVIAIQNLISNPHQILDIQNQVICDGEFAEVNIIEPQRYENVLWTDGYIGDHRVLMEEGTYSIVANSHGCTFQDSVLIREKDCRSAAIFVPNSFSPNGDGINDELSISSINIEIISFRIYNRWGSEVYYTNTYPTWNGTFRGQICSPDVFVWMIEYKDLITGHIEIKAGDVTVMR